REHQRRRDRDRARLPFEVEIREVVAHPHRVRVHGARRRDSEYHARHGGGVKTIEPIATASVAARALFARPWAGGWLIEVDDDGVLVVDRELIVRAHHPRAGDVSDAALDRDGTLLTLA